MKVAAMVLPEADRARLVKLLGLCNSAHAGERANAATTADELIRGHGLIWHQVIATDRARPSFAGQSGPRTWRHVVSECRQHVARLSTWEGSFLANLAGWREPLTARQRAKLNDIADRLGVEPGP